MFGLTRLVAVASSKLGQRDVVIVTDRYPPDTRGGAEVSLHILLRDLAQTYAVVVMAFGDGWAVRSYEIDGVSVLRVPRQARWPLQGVPEALAKRIKQNGGPVSRRTTSALAWAGMSTTDVDDLLRPLLHPVDGEPRPVGGLVVDFAEYEGVSWAVAAVRTVIETCKPRLIHADNYRSILAVAAATRGATVHTLGVVRDNRFRCARHSQSVTVAGKLCGDCEFACATEDYPARAEAQASLLRRVADYRRTALRSLDHVVVTSGYLCDVIEDLVPREKMTRVHNSPDDPSMVDDAVMGVGELPGTNVLIVGMLNENKGQAEFVRHLNRLAERVPDVCLHFAGRGDKVARGIIESATAQGQRARVVLHGYLGRRELLALYRQCQIVVSPSIWPEPFGRVPLEAGSTRRPVVAFRIGGHKETIVHGKTGLLVEGGDYAGMVTAIAELASDATRRWTMGEAARAHVYEAYAEGKAREVLRQAWVTLMDTAVG